MNTTLEYKSSPEQFEQNNQERLDLINRMDNLHKPEAQGILFGMRSRLIARKAAQIAAREETYPMQAFDLATRLAALNPRLEKKAHTILERKIAGKEDMPRPLEELTYRVLEKTVERSSDNEDDTIPLPRLVIAADHELTEERISHYPPSEEMQNIANAQEAEYNRTHQPVVSNVVTLNTSRNIVSPESAASVATGAYDSRAATALEDQTGLHKIAS